MALAASGVRGLSIFHCLPLSVYLEVVLEFSLSLPVAIVDVADDDAVLEQCNTWAYIHGVLQVVATDKDGCPSLLIIFFQQVLDGALAAGIEEIKRLVEDDNLGLAE